MEQTDRDSIIRLEERVENWMNTTTEYRHSLCEKINEIKVSVGKVVDTVNNLPCKERGEITKGQGVTNKLIWAAIGIVFGLLVAHMGWK